MNDYVRSFQFDYCLYCCIASSLAFYICILFLFALMTREHFFPHPNYIYACDTSNLYSLFIKWRNNYNIVFLLFFKASSIRNLTNYFFEFMSNPYMYVPICTLEYLLRIFSLRNDVYFFSLRNILIFMIKFGVKS